MAEKKRPQAKPQGEKTERKTGAVQIDGELARMAAVIASHRRISVAALLSPELRAFLLKEYAKVQVGIGKELSEMGGADGG